MLQRRRISARNKNEAKKDDKEQAPVLHQQIPSEIWEECHQGLKPLPVFKERRHPANSTSRDGDGGYRVREGLSRRVRSIGIAERRISGKVRAKEIGFISRRASYRAIRANK